MSEKPEGDVKATDTDQPDKRRSPERPDPSKRFARHGVEKMKKG